MVSQCLCVVVSDHRLVQSLLAAVLEKLALSSDAMYKLSYAGQELTDLATLPGKAQIELGI